MGISSGTLISKIIAPLIWHELIDTVNVGKLQTKKKGQERSFSSS